MLNYNIYEDAHFIFKCLTDRHQMSPTHYKVNSQCLCTRGFTLGYHITLELPIGPQHASTPLDPH